MKTCTGCGETQPFSEYTKHKLGRDGLRPRCRSCTAIESAEYRDRNVERRAEYNREYKRLNADKHRAHNKAWIDKNPEKTKAHRAVRAAVARGTLVRPDACSECGAADLIHAHHDDYSKPLEVTWVCPQCHADKGVMQSHEHSSYSMHV